MFLATGLKHLTTTTCTGADGVYAVTHATYTGTATSADPRLDGTLRVQVKSVVNTTTNLGFLRGTFHVRDVGGGSANGTLVGVLSGGTLQGFATGDLRGPHPAAGMPHPARAELLGSVTASFTPAGGFTAGSLGVGPATDTAIALTGSCPGGDD
jgi:hypothetical protein